MTQQEFHERISSHFEGPKEDQSAFLSMCRYLSGQYDEEASFRELNAQVSKWEFERNRQHRHRIFYLALPLMCSCLCRDIYVCSATRKVT